MPDPVYAVYYGAAVMAGAEPVLLPATAATGFLPDLEAIPSSLLERTALFYLCTPANPQGSVADLDYLRRAVRLARRHGFVLAVDECYSELWDTAPPPGALEAALAEDGRFDSVVVFHSLSKRSSAAGLRSGFVAGDRRSSWPACCACAPMPRRCSHCRCWPPPPPSGRTRRMSRTTAPATAPSSTPPSAASATASASTVRLAASSSGSMSATARPPAAACGARAASVCCRAATSRSATQGSNAGSAYIRVALVDEPALIDTALGRLGDVLAAA